MDLWTAIKIKKKKELKSGIKISAHPGAAAAVDAHRMTDWLTSTYKIDSRSFSAHFKFYSPSQCKYKQKQTNKSYFHLVQFLPFPSLFFFSYLFHLLLSPFFFLPFLLSILGFPIKPASYRSWFPIGRRHLGVYWEGGRGWCDGGGGGGGSGGVGGWEEPINTSNSVLFGSALLCSSTVDSAAAGF